MSYPGHTWKELRLVRIVQLLDSQVWRYPCQSPRDLCVLEAVEPPPGSWLSTNCLTLSRYGHVNTKLAGGDLDGDLNQAIRPRLSLSL